MHELNLEEIVQQLRLAGTDTQDVEVKSAGKEYPKSLSTTISAFSNGVGGLIILGLDENDDFRPVKNFNPNKIEQTLGDAVSNKFTPPVNAEVRILPFEGSQVVVANIKGLPPQDKPCYITDRGMYGGSYIRVSDRDRKLGRYEVDRLLEAKTTPTYDKEICPEATVEDLDLELVSKVIERERILHPRIFGKLQDAEIRRKMHITGELGGIEHPTVAGLLALGKYPQEFFPQLMISYTVHEGSNKTSTLAGTRFLDSGKLLGSIPAMVADGVQVVQRNMKVKSTVEGAFRKDSPDYSLIAIREALTNALMHRDYSPHAQGAQVQLNMYVDRLEISNPGGLFGNVTIETLGQQGVSSSRNQILANILESTPYEGGGYVAENRGSGYMEMVEQQNRHLLQPPIPKDSLTEFSITFPKRALTHAEMNANRGHSSKETILQFLTQNKTATIHELAAAAGIAPGSTRRILKILVDQDIVQRMEPARSPKQRYRLAGKQ